MRTTLFALAFTACALLHGADCVSYNVPAPQFKGGKNVKTLRERFDGLRYLRAAESNSFAVCAVTKEVSGKRLVFATVRIGAKKPLDPAAAEITLLSAKGADGKRATIASWPVEGSLGDESWQVVSLGELDLDPGMLLTLKSVSAFYSDIRRVTFMQKTFFEGGVAK